MGRPTKLDPAIHTKIVALIRAGNYLETAAATVGIDPRTLRHWLRKGARGIEPYRQFAAEVDEAMGEAETAALAMLRAHGRKDWRALAWWLERTRPARFGQTLAVTQRVESELRDGIEQLRDGLDRPTFERVVRLLARGGSGRVPGDDPDE